MNNLDPEKAAKAADGIVKDVVEGLIKPVYEDLAQPAVKEVGKAVGGLVRTALLPVNAIVWTGDKVKDWVLSEVEKRLSGVDPEKIISPNPAIAGPAIEAIKFLSQEEELRSMFANLIASSMNADVADQIHPGFVEIIKNISSTDAKVLKQFWKKNYLYCGVIVYSKILPEKKTFSIMPLGRFYPQLIKMPLSRDEAENSITNLIRLGLVETSQDSLLAQTESTLKLFSENEAYRLLLSQTDIQSRIDVLQLTGMGQIFVKICTLIKKP
jgi:hypothetical protein